MDESIQEPKAGSRHPDGSTALKRVLEIGQDSDEEQHSNQCPICLDPWGSSGPHRICSLKCGHIFGSSCIQRWIKTSKSCPNCHERATQKDIRLLFVSNVSTVDSTLLDSMRQQLEDEKRRRVQAESDRIRLRVQVESLQQQLRWTCQQQQQQQPKLQNPQRQRDQNQAVVVQVANSDENTGVWAPSFVFETSLVGARGCVFSGDTILASSTFSGAGNGGAAHGLMKVSLADPRHFQCIRVHQEPIRDVKASELTPHLVLTTSNDKSVKVVDAKSSQRVVLSHTLLRGGWSCEWDKMDPNFFYCGSLRGLVSVFDIRRTAHALADLSTGSQAPIHSITSVVSGTRSGGPAKLVCASVGGVFASSWHPAACLAASPTHPPLSPSSTATTAPHLQSPAPATAPVPAGLPEAAALARERTAPHFRALSSELLSGSCVSLCACAGHHNASGGGGGLGPAPPEGSRPSAVVVVASFRPSGGGQPAHASHALLHPFCRAAPPSRPSSSTSNTNSSSSTTHAAASASGHDRSFPHFDPSSSSSSSFSRESVAPHSPPGELDDRPSAVLTGHTCRQFMSKACVWTSPSHVLPPPSPSSSSSSSSSSSNPRRRLPATFVASGDEGTGEGLIWRCSFTTEAGEEEASGEEGGCEDKEKDQNRPLLRPRAGESAIVQRLQRHPSPMLQLQHRWDASSHSELLACVSATQLSLHRKRDMY